MLTLPKPLEQRVWQAMVEIERKAQMKYVTSVERLAIERGVLQGIEQGKLEGKTEGKTEGKAEGKAELVLRLLTRRFGTPPDWVPPRLQTATPDQLDTWAERTLDAATLAEVFDNH
jgi:hypothetical protein